MASILEANYSKRLGLPGHSSHQYSITLRTELPDVTQAAAETVRLCALLQAGIDRHLQSTLPIDTRSIKNGHRMDPSECGPWNCSLRQKEMIQRLIAEKHIDQKTLDQLTQERFGKPVKFLTKFEASVLGQELMERNNQNHFSAGN
jgi:hypothetical protein